MHLYAIPASRSLHQTHDQRGGNQPRMGHARLSKNEAGPREGEQERIPCEERRSRPERKSRCDDRFDMSRFHGATFIQRRGPLMRPCVVQVSTASRTSDKKLLSCGATELSLVTISLSVAWTNRRCSGVEKLRDSVAA